ncbi:MAG: DUF2490 domain-containing protein [Flavobacteriales bacterium]
MQAQVAHHAGFFPTVDHTGTLTDKLDYSLYYFGAVNALNSEVNGSNESAHLFAFYAEQALTYKLNAQWSLTGSYVYERQRPFQDAYRNENRAYIQLQNKYQVGKSTIKHRLRYDARFIENRLLDETNFTSRIRYLLGWKTALKNEKYYFNAYNEFFFNTFKSSTAIYGENWAYAAVGKTVNERHSFELGPLYIFWVNSNRNELKNFYYLQFSWNSYIDFRKKKGTDEAKITG